MDYKIDKNTKVILYGASAIGEIMKYKIEKLGITIIGFIDKRADEISTFLDLPVWNIENFANIYTEDIVVFISVKNVYEHSKIAQKLYCHGIDHIVYLPFNSIYNKANEKEKSIENAYNDLWNDKYPVKTISKINNEFFDFFIDWGLVFEQNDYLVSYIPAEFIYTDIFESTSAYEKWGDINILSFFPYIGLFRFLEGKRENSSLNDYIEDYVIDGVKNGVISITEKWKNNVIENRAMIFEQMNLSLNIDSEYFIKNSVEAIWNDMKGHFNIKSGKHRCAFQISRDMYYIPLRITKKDYQKFINISMAKEIYNEISPESPCIPNPFFYKICNYGREFYYHILSTYSYKLAKYSYKKYGKVFMNKIYILDLTNTDDNLMRHFRKMGCNVYSNQVQSNLSIALDKLQYCHNKVKNKNLTNITYDVVFALGEDKDIIKNMVSDYKYNHVVAIVKNKIFEMKFDNVYMFSNDQFIGIYELHKNGGK